MMTLHKLLLVGAGDWFKVERLIRESNGDDVALVNAWNKIGAYYSDRQKWSKAAQYYTQVIRGAVQQMYAAWIAVSMQCLCNSTMLLVASHGKVIPSFPS